jgi:23S rRNA (uracil-5-)-methyltransferase RumA
LKTKEQRLSDLFAPLKIGPCGGIVASPEIFYHRNKMEYALAPDGYGVSIGLRKKKRFYKVVDIDECPVFMERVRDVFNIFKEWMRDEHLEPYRPRSHSGDVRYAAMRHSKRRDELMVTAVLTRGSAAAQDLAERLRKIANVKSVYACVNDAKSDVSIAGSLELVYGAARIKENINGVDYLISPDAFFQTNPYCCAELYKEIKDNVGNIGGVAIDACCGSGGIALQVAPVFEHVTGVDISQAGIAGAVSNAKTNGIYNVDFICDDAEKFLSRTTADSRVSTLILDPPRSGLGAKSKETIRERGAENVVYVSCNPARLAEDLKALMDAYSVKKMIALDMFPHTWHAEVIAILKRNKV